jgi:hypothetical protein
MTDLDLDGDLDLAVAERDADAISIALNEGQGTFDLPKRILGGKLPVNLVAFDFEADGDVDLAAGHAGSKARRALTSTLPGTST